MHHQAGGFVEDDEIIVLMQHLQRDFLRAGFDRLRRRFLHGNNVARLDFRPRLRAGLIQQDVARFDQALDARTGEMGDFRR